MKTMLITGASRGIGAATALLAAEQGFAVVVNYHKNKQAAEEVVNKIQAMGGKAAAIHADISEEKEIIRLYKEIDEIFGDLHVLVNNAGILEQQSRLETMDASRLTRIFAINVTGQMICAREAIKRMSFKYGGKGGSIVNVSSLASKTGSPNEYIDYATSKGAIDSFTKGLSKEIAEEGIRVNGVRPAFIYTDIHADGGEADRVDRIKNNIPMKRGGTPEEVAEAIMWLASEKSSYSTGTFIDVTGGR
ncbi:SDR family oxidoreductase [Zunongwangia sp. F363]|uniref:SDR family oxidoreductase n=1 Tax=Autumnicola tepida TaxID=3075595 RepID=A0ABU3CEN1_9FLAO|nr:SDR family oxidoreductase [Zunongwangia sp. F363]MDT0644813.1 SDR family oxidoreductase [Zunongwangia sp. F363]